MKAPNQQHCQFAEFSSEQLSKCKFLRNANFSEIVHTVELWENLALLKVVNYCKR